MSSSQQSSFNKKPSPGDTPRTPDTPVLPRTGPVIMPDRRTPNRTLFSYAFRDASSVNIKLLHQRNVNLDEVNQASLNLVHNTGQHQLLATRIAKKYKEEQSKDHPFLSGCCFL